MEFFLSGEVSRKIATQQSSPPGLASFWSLPCLFHSPNDLLKTIYKNCTNQIENWQLCGWRNLAYFLFLFKLCESPLNIDPTLSTWGKERISVAKGPYYYKITKYTHFDSQILRDFKKIVDLSQGNFEISWDRCLWLACWNVRSELFM